MTLFSTNDTLGATTVKERLTSWTPFLFQVGDSKDAVRKGVRSLFRELCSFYPPTKLFGFVLDGLKSKNARQRTGENITAYCTGVCGEGCSITSI